MAAHSAHTSTTQLRRRSATISAAHRIALEDGLISLSAPPLVETESRSAPIASAALLLMVAWNAHAVTIRLTPWLAMMVRALSIARARGQPGRIVLRNATVARRHPGSCSTPTLRTEETSVPIPHMKQSKRSATPMRASPLAEVGSVSGASAAKSVVGARRTAPTLWLQRQRACLRSLVLLPMVLCRPTTAICTSALKVMFAPGIATELVDNDFGIDL